MASPRRSALLITLAAALVLVPGAARAGNAEPGAARPGGVEPGADLAGAPVLLINGDTAVSVPTVGGGPAWALRPARGAGPARPLMWLRLGGRSIVIPAVAAPYLGRGLDVSLFDLAALRRAGDAGRLPVSLRYRGRLPALPGITVTHAADSAAEGYLTAGSAARFGAALARQMRADQARASYGTDGLFADGLTVSLPGVAAPARPARAAPTASARVPMHTLIVRGINQAGRPDNGDPLDVLNVDSNAAFPWPDGHGAFHHGTARFSVPAGP